MAAQFPRVFVGAPYGRGFEAFRTALEHLPCRFAVARDFIVTEHLLEICNDLVSWADFCLFDVSTWNSNVTLELGLSEGKGTPYYILFNAARAEGVPADIRGLQRLAYRFVSITDADHNVRHSGLWYMLGSHLARTDKHLLGPLWERFEATAMGDRQRLYCCALLSRLRNGRSVSLRDLPDLTEGLRRGARRRDEARSEALKILRQRKLIRQSTTHVTLPRRLFPPPYKPKYSL